LPCVAHTGKEVQNYDLSDPLDEVLQILSAVPFIFFIASAVIGQIPANRVLTEGIQGDDENQIKKCTLSCTVIVRVL
jgi:hypothetical protein